MLCTYDIVYRIFLNRMCSSPDIVYHNIFSMADIADIYQHVYHPSQLHILFQPYRKCFMALSTLCVSPASYDALRYPSASIFTPLLSLRIFS